jgi:protein-histidine pros-kinase
MSGSRPKQRPRRAYPSTLQEKTVKLLLKFNLVFLLIFAIGLAASGSISWSLLERNARQEIAESARLLMDAALSARNYTSDQVGPLLETQMKYTFLPQSLPAYAASEMFRDLNKKYVEYSYKEAVLNPTNPRNRAVEWEADVISQFRSNKDQTQQIGERDTPSGRSFYIARPIRITDAACLRCHSTIDAAPKTLIERYGPANGFGWNLNEAVGAQIISVPAQVPLDRARQVFKVFMGSIAGVFIIIGIMLDLMLWLIVIQPMGGLSKFADRVSLGDLDIPDPKVGSRDEIGTLTESVGRMRTNLVMAMKMLGA